MSLKVAGCRDPADLWFSRSSTVAGPFRAGRAGAEGLHGTQKLPKWPPLQEALMTCAEHVSEVSIKVGEREEFGVKLLFWLVVFNIFYAPQC